ncbi:MAG TPA: universal stress protein [Acidimicrobiales bacterium]
MFNTVLVGADDSETARRAVEAAAEIAKMSSGQLHIVSAFDPRTFSTSSVGGEFNGLTPESDIDALLQVLSFIAKKNGVEPVLHSVKGDPAEVVIDTANKISADLVVVGNRGMKGVRRVLGSVPNSIAHGAPCSVLIVDTTD